MLCNPWTAGVPIHNQLPESASNSCPSSLWCHSTISSSAPPPSPSAFNLSQHQGHFQWVHSFASGGQSIGASPSVLPMNIQGWFLLGCGLVGSPCSSRDSQESSTPPQFKSINFLVLSFLYGPKLTSIHDNWKNHSFDYMYLCWLSNIFAF